MATPFSRPYNALGIIWWPGGREPKDGGCHVRELQTHYQKVHTEWLSWEAPYWYMHIIVTNSARLTTNTVTVTPVCCVIDKTFVVGSILHYGVSGLVSVPEVAYSDWQLSWQYSTPTGANYDDILKQATTSTCHISFTSTLTVTSPLHAT